MEKNNPINTGNSSISYVISDKIEIREIFMLISIITENLCVSEELRAALKF